MRVVGKQAVAGFVRTTESRVGRAIATYCRSATVSASVDCLGCLAYLHYETYQTLSYTCDRLRPDTGACYFRIRLLIARASMTCSYGNSARPKWP